MKVLNQSVAYKDHLGRAWQATVTEQRPGKCYSIGCIRIGIIELSRQTGGLRRRELKCFEHFQEFAKYARLQELSAPEITD